MYKDANTVGLMTPNIGSSTKKSAVIIELDKYAQLLDILHEKISELSKKIEPILSPSPESASKTDSANKDSMKSGIPLVSDLVGLNDKLDSVIDRINMLIERIEL